MGRKKTIENDKTFKINLLEIRKEEIFLTGNKCKLVELKSVIIFYADLSSKQDSYEYIYATQNSFMHKLHNRWEYLDQIQVCKVGQKLKCPKENKNTNLEYNRAIECNRWEDNALQNL